jgi:hypothetical protein
MAEGRMPKTRGEWEQIYKTLVRVPDYTRGQKQRRGMVNGIDIHRDFRPWAVFGLNPKTATAQDVRNRFRKLAIKVHPDTGGSARDFERLKQMRDSMLAFRPASKTAGSSRRRSKQAASASPAATGPINSQRLLPPSRTTKPPRRRRKPAS